MFQRFQIIKKNHFVLQFCQAPDNLGNTSTWVHSIERVLKVYIHNVSLVFLQILERDKCLWPTSVVFCSLQTTEPLSGFAHEDIHVENSLLDNWDI